MKREDKQVLVDRLHGELKESAAVFVTEYKGLDVETLTRLRRGISGAGGSYRVVKNTLLRRASTETPADLIKEHFVGPTAIATVKEDPLGVAKALVDFVKDNEALKVQAGILGEQVLDFKSIQELAKMPSKEVLLAKMLGSMNAPVGNFVGVMAAMLRQLVYVLKAIEEQKAQTV